MVGEEAKPQKSKTSPPKGTRAGFQAKPVARRDGAQTPEEHDRVAPDVAVKGSLEDHGHKLVHGSQQNPHPEAHEEEVGHG
jgi:hypothetical protein